MRTPITAMIVDDNRPLRKLHRFLLNQLQLFESIVEAENGQEAVTLANSTRPGLILLDLLMPVMDGFEALPLLRKACPDARIVVLSMVQEASVAGRVMGLGADAFLDKGHDDAVLSEKIRALVVGSAG